MMSTYRAYQVTGQREFELVEREVVRPKPGHVRFRTQSCGVCHSDTLGVEGMRDDPSQPIVPGHEVVGVIDAVGEDVTAWQVGDRVGLGFLGGHCGECQWCRRGDFVNCANQPQPGTTEDGGYAEVVYARANGLVRVPDVLSSVHASPLLCAGITTYNALRKLDAEPGALVGIQGIAGLATSASNTPASWVTAWRPSLAAPKKAHWQQNSALTSTSTAQPSIPERRSANSAAPRRSSPPPPMELRCRRCWVDWPHGDNWSSSVRPSIRSRCRRPSSSSAADPSSAASPAPPSRTRQIWHSAPPTALRQ
jgi:hypothetical protein